MKFLAIYRDKSPDAPRIFRAIEAEDPKQAKAAAPLPEEIGPGVSLQSIISERDVVVWTLKDGFVV